MYTYGNHICVSSVKEHLRTSDYGVMVTFEQKCIYGWNDQRPILAKLESTCKVEKFIE